MSSPRFGGSVFCRAALIVPMLATTASGAALQRHADVPSAPSAAPANDLQVWLLDIHGAPLDGVPMFVHRPDQPPVQAVDLGLGVYFVERAGQKVWLDLPVRHPSSAKKVGIRGIELSLKDAEINYVAIQVDLETGYVRHIDQKSAYAKGHTGTKPLAGLASDDCKTAELVPCNGSVTFDNTSNTTDPSDPAFGCHFGGPAQGVGSTWFKFVATQDTAFLDTNLSAVSDTLLAIYDGTCGSLVEIACSEDEGVGLLSEVCVAGLAVGNEYLVQVASFSASSLGSITLSTTCPGPCVSGGGDECTEALTVDCNGEITFDNSSNTTNPSDPEFSCHFGSPAQGVGTTWVQFMATNTTAFLDTNASAVSDTLLAVYDGSCGALVEIACSEDEGVGLLSEVCAEGLTVGNTYLVQVASFSASSLGQITLSVACPGPCVGADNDECEGAVTVACGDSLTFDNSKNTTSPTDPPFSCHFGAPAQGEGTTWFKFVATADSSLLDTNLSAVSDTLLAVYDGSCGSLVELACSEDEGVGLLSEVCVEGLSVGSEYIVQVASYSASSLGSITLRIQCPCPGLLANDDCTGAELVPTLPASVFVDNSRATDDIVAGTECGVASGPFKNVWYSVTGTGNTMTATTCNSGTLNSDTKISVFCGECRDRTCVAGNDDDCPSSFSSTVSWCSQAGANYLITVGNFSSSATAGGAIQMDVFDDGVPCKGGVQCLLTGACCLADGSCVETSAVDCATQGGDYQGDGVPCGENVIVDGGFEGGQFSGNWTETSTNFGTPICSTALCGFGGGTGPHAGDFWCWFGGVSAFEVGSVEQDVLIPTSATTLDFYLEIPISSGNGTDFMSVLIDGNELFTALESDGPFMGYTLVSIPLGAFADSGTHAVRFESTITGMPSLSNFFVDDVSINVETGLCAPECSVLDFETADSGAPVVNGEAIANQFASLVTITGTGANHGAAAFDSTPLGPNDPSDDPDLLVGSGNVLILQENGIQTFPGIFDLPDDDSDGGTLIFEFSGPVEVRSLDLIDVDLPSPVQDAAVLLLDGSGNGRLYDVPQGWTEDLVLDGPPGFRTLDTTTLAPQPGFQSVATATEDPGFNPFDVVRMEVFFSSSAAVDNVEVCPSD